MKNKNLPLRVAAFFLAFSFGSFSAQDTKSLISQKLSSQSTFMRSDLQNFEIISQDFSKSMNSDIIKVQQSYNGIPVHNALATALVKDSKVNYFTDSFAKNYSKAALPSSARSAKSIFTSLTQNLSLKNAVNYKIISFNDADLEVPFAKTRLIYVLAANNELKLGHEFLFEEKGTSNYWDLIADAATGEILYKQNLTVSCTFNHGAFSHDYSAHAPAGFANDFSEKNTEASIGPPPLGATYNVFALPVESPAHGSRFLVSNPWLNDASPDGWHTISGGTFTNTFTTTRGNNVMAYDDKAKANAPGNFADGGASRYFDFPFVANDTSGNLNAAITNLFYVNNKVHDIFYRFGFTETAKNFQAYNFNKGGLQNDYVQAEVQDGSGKNNANFATPMDGSRPRMQMYLFDPPFVDRLFYNKPSQAVGRNVITYVSTTFGPALTATGVTADVVISPVVDACTALPAGSLAGKIGLIARGGCDFQAKVQAAQNAGAVAAIIYNLPTSTATGGMAGVNANITIPSVLIENVEGEYMKSLLASSSPVNVTLKYDETAQKMRDASFDNGIIIHEYGHGISSRLVGQLNESLNKEQMGEGWSDFFALMLTNRPGDKASVARGMGTYSKSQEITGGGIRPARYTPDTAINNFTYGRTNGMEYTNTSNELVPDVHSIGFVWATMLWDLHWKYVEKYGYASDVVANPDSGSARVLQLVVDGLKLTPVNPGFIEGRNAILSAEMATTKGENKCIIWDVFAKRGLGLFASAGLPTDINDQTEDFTTATPDPACKAVLATTNVNADSSLSLYPNPAKNEFFIKSAKNGLGKINVEIFDATGKLVSSQKVSGAEAVNTQSLPNGMYVVKASGIGVDYSSKLIIRK